MSKRLQLMSMKESNGQVRLRRIAPEEELLQKGCSQDHRAAIISIKKFIIWIFNVLR